MTLKGHQLSILVEIPPYPITNPTPGEAIATRAGTATVIQAEPIGNTAVIWADYGSGTAQPHTSEPQPGDFLYGQTLSGLSVAGRFQRRTTSGMYLVQVGTRDNGKPNLIMVDPTTCKRTTHQAIRAIAQAVANPPPMQTTPSTKHPQNSTTTPSRQRRHSPKGKAVGWIEERHGNLKRKTPSTSYYYCWQEGDRRGKTYIPIRQIATIREMVNARRSVDDILQAIGKGEGLEKVSKGKG